ncbi:MAG: hypothetical protein NZ523_06670, partial [Elioraea sp.]|nr:hypothetical protein [Elioraea sp.]
RLPSRMILWGGAIGLRRDAAEGLDLSRTWKGALSDDLTLTRRARLAGERMHGVHAALVPTPVCYTLAEAFRFGVRQLRLLRLHLPLEWGMVGLVSLLPAIAAATVATGHPAALAACLLAFTCLQLRLSLRQRIFSQVLPLAATVPVARAVRLARLLFPLAHLLRLACWLASGFGRRIAWAGIDYEVAGINCVRILARRPPRER